MPTILRKLLDKDVEPTVAGAMFSRDIRKRLVMSPAAEAKFRAESERVVGFDLGAHDVLVCTGFIHPSGRILIDSIKATPKCMLCRQRPERGGRRQGSNLCQECYEHDNP